MPDIAYSLNLFLDQVQTYFFLKVFQQRSPFAITSVLVNPDCVITATSTFTSKLTYTICIYIEKINILNVFITIMGMHGFDLQRDIFLIYRNCKFCSHARVSLVIKNL